LKIAQIFGGKYVMEAGISQIPTTSGGYTNKYLGKRTTKLVNIQF
jgi:hypothetical protein